MNAESRKVLSAIRRGEASLPKIRSVTGIGYARLQIILHDLEFSWGAITTQETAGGFARFYPASDEQIRAALKRRIAPQKMASKKSKPPRKLKKRPPNKIQPGLSLRLKAWRERVADETDERFTQVDAAKALEIPYPTYLEYEQGRRGHNMSVVLYRYIIEKTAPSKES